MAKFKVGDRVKRIDGHYNGMRESDEDTVVSSDFRSAVTLEKYGYGHADFMLELVTPSASPIRTITKRELVEGYRPGSSFAFYKHTHADRVIVKMPGDYICPTSKGLREAARCFVEVADYLDENAKDAA